MASNRDSNSLGLSEDLREVVEEAEDIAHAAGQTPSSVHLLMAFFTTRNAAERFLRERSIDEDRLLQLLEPSPLEARHAVRTIMERAAQIAVGSGSTKIDGLHVLIGITRVQDSAAYVLLQRTGEKIPRLRTRALTILTGASHRWLFRENEVTATPRHHLSRIPAPNYDSSIGRSQSISWTPPLLPPKPPKTRRDPPPTRKSHTKQARVPEPNATTSGPLPPKHVDPIQTELLSPDEFPWLTSLGRNLSEEAAQGGLDLLVGREVEVQQLIDILGKLRTNNPCLIGEPGVGKTSIVEGLAAKWSQGTPTERQRVIIALDAGRLLVGTQLRGSFSEKIQGLQDEVRKASGKVIIFFDEIHSLMGVGATSDGSNDAANELKAALARGTFPCIGATTPAEYSKYIAKDPALARRFVPVLVEEPSAQEAESMLYRMLPVYAEHHGVGYTPDAVKVAVKLSTRFIPERQLPDKAIALLDLAGSRAARCGRLEVTKDLIAELVEERTGIQRSRLLASDNDKLLNLEAELSSRIIGHGQAIKRISEVIRRHAVGFSSHRPQGSFLLVGPTGVGKTETAKAISDILHGDPKSLLRFDLSEYSEPHSVARLIGSPPGYVGHDSGGQLTSTVRERPSCVILFDEIEKAHRDVLQLFLQILDDGRITDSHGRTVTFSETIIFLTSNLGAHDQISAGRTIGFGQELITSNESNERYVLDAAKKGLPIELWGRIDEKLYFSPLQAKELKRIAKLLITESSSKLYKERGISFELDSAALETLVSERIMESHLGARPLRRMLSQLVEAPIAARILEGRLHAGDKVRVSFDHGRGLVFRVGTEHQTLSQRPLRT